MVMDIDFSPYDDISYHMMEVKTGIRCVVVKPYNGVRTDYVQKDMQDIINKLWSVKEEGARINDLETKEIAYKVKGEVRKIVAIYSSNSYFQSTVIRYKDCPLIYSNSCIIVGENFTDLTMEQCYALVKSARAVTIDKLTSISVNIYDNMDLVPRILSEHEFVLDEDDE